MMYVCVLRCVGRSRSYEERNTASEYVFYYPLGVIE